MRILAPVLALSLLTSQAAVAADARPVLAPGKAAGVKQAQLLSGNTVLLLIGVGILIGGIILITSDGDGSTTTTSTAAP